MHEYCFDKYGNQLLTEDIVALLGEIREAKGRQNLLIEAEADGLSALLEVAKIQSTKASNRIEGIFTSDERLESLVKHRAEPRNRSEEEIAGYREVLATVHENYEYITPRGSNILQMHRDLYSFSSGGGTYKNSDNVIAETDREGVRRVRFTPVPAFQTPDAVERLCEAYNQAVQASRLDPLLLIPMFVLDFLCIHPFNDGNGRMSRLLTLLLLYRAGYYVGKYISIEMLIEQSKETYYEALRASSEGWHENANDYAPFVRYMLGVVLKACRELDARVRLTRQGAAPKGDQVRAVFDQRLGRITKSDLVAQCPGVSVITIERTLRQLLEEGYIEKVGRGRSTGYVRKS